jgi:hypothetical protein
MTLSQWCSIGVLAVALVFLAQLAVLPGAYEPQVIE